MAKVKIGLFGLGTVGEGIVRVIGKARNANAEIKRICVRNISKQRNVYFPSSLITNNPQDVLDDE